MCMCVSKWKAIMTSSYCERFSVSIWRLPSAAQWERTLLKKKKEKNTPWNNNRGEKKHLSSPRLFNDKQQCSGTQWRLKVPATFKSRVIVDFVNQCPSVLLDVSSGTRRSGSTRHHLQMEADWATGAAGWMIIFFSFSFFIRRRCQN